MTLPLAKSDSHHLDALQGWLGLGALKEARAELNQLSPAAFEYPHFPQHALRVMRKGARLEHHVRSRKTIHRALPGLARSPDLHLLRAERHAPIRGGTHNVAIRRR